MSEGLADRHALLLTVAAADIDDLDHLELIATEVLPAVA